MAQAVIIGTMILKMFIMMSVGMVGSATRIITDEGNKALTDILLQVVTPILIVVSYQVDYSSDKLQGLLMAIALSVVSHFVAIIISVVAIKKKGNQDFQVERMGTVYSNCGNMGIPLLFATFGEEGVFYVTAYLTVFNLFVWSHGVALMTGAVRKKDILTILRSPNIIAILIGLSFFITGIRLPKIFLEPMQSIALVNTPLAMLIVGATLFKSQFVEIIKNKGVYYVAFLRLLLVPLVMILIFKVFNLSGLIPTIVLIATACPIASTGTMFAVKHKKNANYAAGLLSFTTLLSIMSIPLMVIIFSWFQ